MNAANSPAPNLYARSQYWQRDLDIARDYYVYGETSREIAIRYSLSRGRIHQIIADLARKHSFATEQTPHLRLPDDIAANLDARRHQGRHHPAAGGKYIVKVWTPEDVEAETTAGYWRVRHVNNPNLWSLRARRKKKWLDWERSRPWRLADYLAELEIPLPPMRSPASGTPACGQSPPIETAPRSR